MSCPTRRTASTARPNMSTTTSPTAISAASAARSAATTARRRRSLITKVLATGADSSDIILDIFGHEHEVHVNLPGRATTSTTPPQRRCRATLSALEEQTAVSALSQFECGFGRAEQFKLGQAPGAHDAG